MAEFQQNLSHEDPDLLVARMKVVERVVRPLQASIHRKRKIRDELFIHLSAIYDEEVARQSDTMSALDAATRRFGNPVELTAEFQVAVPWIERWEAWMEPIFGWRAPETAGRWMLRVGWQMSLLFASMCFLAAILALREFGRSTNVWLAIRPLVAAAIAFPISVSVSGFTLCSMRDCIYGVFGSRKSWRQAFLWAGMLAVLTTALGIAFLTVAYGNFEMATAAFYPCLATGVLWAGGLFAIARVMGPQTIQDTYWAILDLRDQPISAD